MPMRTYRMTACAGAVLAAMALCGGAFAAGQEGDSYNFEGAADGTALADAGLSGLYGSGTIKTAAYSPAAKTSYPLPAADHTAVLEIAGTVAYTNVTAFDNANNASQVDFMFKVEPTDELETPADTANIQVALAVGETNAVGTTAPIMLWCRETSEGDPGWVTLLADAATGSWVRATFVLDYGRGACRVSLDSDPVNGGAWYYFAGTAAQQYIKSITMVGSTQIDDFAVKNESIVSYNPYKDANGNPKTVTAGGTAVPLKYLNDYGVTQAQATGNNVLNANSGMTVEQKYVAGLDPKSDTKFEMKTMTTEVDSAKVTFPGMNGNGAYTLKAGTTKGGSDVGTAVSTQTSGSGECMNSATVAIPPEKQGQLLYFTVETN